MESQPQFTPPLQDIPKPEPDEAGHEEGPPSHRQGGDIDFRLKPEELEEYLNRFVVDQPQAVEVLATKICTHFNRTRLELEERVSNEASLGNIKSNVLMIGPTGVGKTFIIKLIADRIGVPFVKGDATKFSETGYVGGDVEDLVRDLVRRADGDIDRAQYGIIFLDEIDKIAAATNLTGRDVSGRGVQTNLLKLMEETEVPARAPHDIAGQLQAMMEMTQGRAKKQPAVINTRHILFVVSGAFGGLEKIVRKRLREATIGFAAATKSPVDEDRCLEEAQTRDFIEFGFEPEFIGRLPVRVVCQQLTVDDLFDILKTSEGSIIRQYEQSFGAYGIEVLFADEGLRRIAELAAEEKTGARGLMTVCERVFRDLKFELPSTPVRRFEVTRQLVDHPSAELQRLLAERAQEERVIMRQVVHEFARRFTEAHGLKLVFTDTAAGRLVDLAFDQQKAVRDLCAERFKDFQFGLRLIAQNTGQQEFTIDVPAVETPDRVLSEWVVASYRSGEGRAD